MLAKISMGWIILAFVLIGAWPALGEELVVYSGRGEKFTRPVVNAFTARTGIRAKSLVGNSGQMLAKIGLEGARTPADIFMTNYAGVLERARTRELLQTYHSPMLANVPAEYVGRDAMWFGASARARAIIYNKNMSSGPPVTSIMDLAKPRWRGKLGITVSTNGSFVGGLATMIGQHGEASVRAFLEGIKTNAGDNVFPKHTPIVSAVARGEIALGLVNHYYFYRAISKNPAAPIGIVFPDQMGAGAATTISGLAILRHAKHLGAARKFVDFVLSREGQKIFADLNFEIPVSREVAAHALLPPRKSLRLAPVNQGLKLEKIDQAVEMIKSVGMQ